LKGLLFNEKNIKVTAVFLLGLCVFLCVLLFNVNHLTTRLSIDCVNYAKSIENSRMDEVFHPHHLFYNYFKWLVFMELKEHGYEGRALLVSQIFNCTAGALGVALLFLAIVYVTRSVFTGLLASSVSTFSFGWWYCSVFGGVRVMGTTSLVLAFLLISYFVLSKEKDFKKNAAVLVLAALSHSMAVFSHQTHVLFIFAAVSGILFKKTTWRHRMLYAALYSAVLCFTVAFFYYYVGAFVYHFHNWEGFYAWLVSYTKLGLWGKWEPYSFKFGLNGIKRLFVGALFGGDKLLLNIENRAVESILWYSVIALFVYGLFSARRIIRNNLPIAVMCLVWLATYTPFFMWWEPENVEFWVYPMPAVLILLSMPAADLMGRWKIKQVKAGWKILAGSAFVVLALVHAAYNYYGTISPWCDVSKSSSLNAVNNLKAINPGGEGLTVIVGVDALYQNIEYYHLGEYVSVYNAVQKNKGDQGAVQEFLKGRIDEKLARKKQVFAEKEVFSLNHAFFLKLLMPDFDREKFTQYLKDKYEIVPASSETGILYFYELKPKRKK
jgi:hypothetical protein